MQMPTKWFPDVDIVSKLIDCVRVRKIHSLECIYCPTCECIDVDE